MNLGQCKKDETVTSLGELQLFCLTSTEAIFFPRSNMILILLVKSRNVWDTKQKINQNIIESKISSFLKEKYPTFQLNITSSSNYAKPFENLNAATYNN